ncbi:unnamed protein product [Oncorhynchus mykiss]|uniref:Uncharacterized protein n=1 Tax=Oncorhynchus mykiss TaxID=8022 RepID=A0A060Z5R2_ONCMY|nr:unnamed protein product [Oncorhynchus mykiss]
MKSGLPKPVHSALPIPQAQNLARSRTSSPHRARPPALRHSPLKALHRQGEGQGKGETTPTPNRSLSTAESEDREDPQVRALFFSISYLLHTKKTKPGVNWDKI